MGEVVDEYERFGRLIVSGAKAPRALLVFGHELTRAVDLRIKRYDLVRDWIHGSSGFVGYGNNRLPRPKFLTDTRKLLLEVAEEEYDVTTF
jgi:hypothetical protein